MNVNIRSMKAYVRWFIKKAGSKRFPTGDKVRKTAKIRKRYNQVPHLIQDTTWESSKNTINITNKSQEVSPFPAGDHKAAMNRRERHTSKLLLKLRDETIRQVFINDEQCFFKQTVIMPLELISRTMSQIQIKYTRVGSSSVHWLKVRTKNIFLISRSKHTVWVHK